MCRKPPALALTLHTGYTAPSPPSSELFLSIQQHHVVHISNQHSLFSLLRTTLDSRNTDNFTMDASSAPTPESATTPTPEPAAVPPPVFFRAGKKKRAFRQRAEETEAEPAAQTDSSATINTSSDATASGQAAASTTEPAVSGTPTTTPAAATGNRDDDKEEGGLSVAEVLRLRNAKKHRLGGVAFRAGDESSPTVQNAEQAMVLHDGVGSGGGGEVQEAAILGGVAKRFAPQTGMVGELVNRHM